MPGLAGQTGLAVTGCCDVRRAAAAVGGCWRDKGALCGQSFCQHLECFPALFQPLITDNSTTCSPVPDRLASPASIPALFHRYPLPHFVGLCILTLLPVLGPHCYLQAARFCTLFYTLLTFSTLLKLLQLAQASSSCPSFTLLSCQPQAHTAPRLQALPTSACALHGIASRCSSAF